MKKYIWLIISLCIGLGASAFAPFPMTNPRPTTFYVDATGGNDSNTGLSPSAAWQTIAKVNGSTFQPGNNILFKKGETWRETLTVPSSGTAGNPITFGAYGSGADPIISGADVEASWSSEELGGENFTDVSGDTPVAYWYFEEESGTRYDETSNSEDLTDNNTVARSEDEKQGTYSADFESDNSETFSRANASLTSGFPGNTGDGATEITAGFWVKFESISGSDIVMFGIGNSWGIWKRNTGPLSGCLRDSGHNPIYADANSNPSTATWYHVVMRYQGDSDNEVALFIDGSKQTDTETESTWAQDQGEAFTIGMHFNSVYFDGLMDEAFVFDTALSDAQIADIYNYGLAGGGGATVYYATGYTTEPNQVFEDDTRMTNQSGSCPDDLDVGEWCYDGGDERVYIRTTGDDSPAGYTIEISQRNRSIEIGTVNYITMDGLTLEKGNACVGGGIYGEGGAAGIILRNSTIKDEYCSAVQYYDASTDSGAWLIESNTFSNNGANDVLIADHGVGWTVRKNTSTGSCSLSGESDHDYCASIKMTTTETTARNHLVELNNITCGGNTNATDSGGGIWMDGVTDADHDTIITIRNNFIKNPEYDAIRIEFADENIVRGNIITGDGTAGNHGIGIARNVDDNEVYNNTVYNVDIGIFVQDEDGGTDCTGNLVKNNIISNTNTRHLQAIWGGNNGAGEGNIYANNNLDENGAQEIIQWSGSYYTSVATWEAAVTGASNNIGSDTLMTDPGNDDFTLQATSPAIDAGADLGTGTDYQVFDDASALPPNTPTLVDQDSDDPPWDIGAYGGYAAP